MDSLAAVDKLRRKAAEELTWLQNTDADTNIVEQAARL